MSISKEEENTLYETYLQNCDFRLFAPADGKPSVSFALGGEWRECRIWEGYLDARLILLRQALRESPRCDNLIFPALFNLRHGIEVALKWHIRYAGGTIPKRAGHNIKLLTEAFRHTAADLDDIANYISEPFLALMCELETIDPRAVTFRYATENDGRPIEIATPLLDLWQLTFTVDELSRWLDSLSGQIELSRDDAYQAQLRAD